jgi:pantoate--beta-alanine ligase
MQQTVLRLRAAGQRVGLVPTMGALHEGHLSLVRAARAECDVTIATIFVNPTQFAPHEDFSKYPRTLEADLTLLDSVGCDIAFVPDREEMYPPGFSTHVEPPRIAEPLEGAFRPGHFRGVCTVVLKLFQLAPAHIAFFGQKDFQQALVVRQMVRDLNVPIEVRTCPIIRESDGLALSSRNRYLSAAERVHALALSQALEKVRDQYRAGERKADVLAAAMHDTLRRAGIESIDYATVVDAETLGELNAIERSAVALIACRVGTTRLIDNELLLPEPK